MRTTKEMKMEKATRTVENMTQGFEKIYTRYDKKIFDNTTINFIKVVFNEELERIEVIGDCEYKNGFVEKVILGHFDVVENYGWSHVNGNKEYVKIHYFQKSIIKFWEEQMQLIGDKISDGLYDMK